MAAGRGYSHRHDDTNAWLQLAAADYCEESARDISSKPQTSVERTPGLNSPPGMTARPFHSTDVVVTNPAGAVPTVSQFSSTRS